MKMISPNALNTSKDATSQKQPQQKKAKQILAQARKTSANNTGQPNGSPNPLLFIQQQNHQ